MKTNKIICAIVLLFSLQHAFAQNASLGKPFTIKGTLIGAKADSVIFDYEGINKSVPVKDNQFTLTGNILRPASSYVFFKKTGEVIPPEKQEERTREFYIEPAFMTTKGNPFDVKTLVMTGSKTQAEFNELYNKVEPVHLEEKSLEAAYYKADMEYINAEKDKKPASVIDSLKYIADATRDQFEPYNARIKRINYQFFTEHPNSYVTLDRVKYDISSMSVDSIKMVYNAFNDKFKAKPDAKEIAKFIKQIEAGSPGAIAPVFTKTDINGKQLSLTDFKGKYVMLDFWASWCVPCRKSNPHMIDLYEKYKGKGFDVIGVASDDGEIAAWNTAVAKDGVGIWHNVLSGFKMDLFRKGIQNPEDIGREYGIATIPTKILIGPDGKILGRYGSYGGSEDDMDKMLASVFDK